MVVENDFLGECFFLMYVIKFRFFIKDNVVVFISFYFFVKGLTIIEVVYLLQKESSKIIKSEFEFSGFYIFVN